jgi:hypothetical protein
MLATHVMRRIFCQYASDKEHDCLDEAIADNAREK